MLVTGRKGTAYIGRYINLHTVLTDDGANFLTLAKKQIAVPPDWIYRGLTLAQMRHEALEAEKQPGKNKKSRHPKRVASASCLWLNKEECPLVN